VDLVGVVWGWDGKDRLHAAGVVARERAMCRKFERAMCLMLERHLVRSMTAEVLAWIPHCCVRQSRLPRRCLPGQTRACLEESLVVLRAHLRCGRTVHLPGPTQATLSSPQRCGRSPPEEWTCLGRPADTAGPASRVAAQRRESNV
jgi:hypothetical protein